MTNHIMLPESRTAVYLKCLSKTPFYHYNFLIDIIYYNNITFSVIKYYILILNAND